MSQIIEAVKRIANCYRQRNRANMPAQLLGYYPPYQTVKNAIRKNLDPNQLELIERHLGNYQPRLSMEEIKQITKVYLFQLPQELYDLYLIGNGCIPIGISEDTDSDSVFNYSYFPSYTASFYTLQDSMKCYMDMMIEDNPLVLPICPCYREDVVLAVIGSEEQQETSPVLITYSDYIAEEDPSNMNVLFPSLTNMMLAHAELCEHQGKWKSNTEKDIVQKYGGDYSQFGYE